MFSIFMNNTVLQLIVEYSIKRDNNRHDFNFYVPILQKFIASISSIDSNKLS